MATSGSRNKSIKVLCLAAIITNLASPSPSFNTQSQYAALLAVSENDLREKKRRRTNWWRNQSNLHAPRLEGGNGKRRPRKFFGRASNYARNGNHSLSAGEYYEHFRFSRDDIPRLVAALQIPAIIRFGPVGHKCAIDGEEALLIFLKVSSSITNMMLKSVSIMSLC
jgi:hypothetical protein